MRHFDVVIVGAGPVGLNFAAQLLAADLNVALVEQLPRRVLEKPPFDGREIALTHASAQRLRDNGVWARLPDAEISPLRDARVWNGSSPFYMQIDHRDGRKEQLGFLVANHLLRRAAWECVHTMPRLTLFCETRVTSITGAADGATACVGLEDGTTLSASLAVAADTRFSDTRRAAGIAATLRDFGRTMLVSRMQHEQPHHHIAWEWFDYGQTLALLPLKGECSSVVVTVDGQEARRLQNLSEVEFNLDIQRRLRGRLGAMRLVSQRYAYPLVGVYADRFVAGRYAVIGDAAVGMHPVTAHGFNLGLLGQATLAQEIIAAAARGQDIGAPDLLARYERAHRRATLPLYLATNALVRLYTAEAPPMRFARRASAAPSMARARRTRPRNRNWSSGISRSSDASSARAARKHCASRSMPRQFHISRRKSVQMRPSISTTAPARSNVAACVRRAHSGRCRLDVNAAPSLRPNTTASSNELLARRFAPCAPLHATSPQAHSRARLERPSAHMRGSAS